jgi:hypothetical protein
VASLRGILRRLTRFGRSFEDVAAGDAAVHSAGMGGAGADPTGVKLLLDEAHETTPSGEPEGEQPEDE